MVNNCIFIVLIFFKLKPLVLLLGLLLRNSTLNTTYLVFIILHFIPYVLLWNLFHSSMWGIHADVCNCWFLLLCSISSAEYSAAYSFSCWWAILSANIYWLLFARYWFLEHINRENRSLWSFGGYILVWFGSWGTRLGEGWQ